MRRFKSFLLFFTLSIMTLGTAVAQTFPSKPITVVVGYPPGTQYDGIMRIIGAEITKKTGQPVVIEFKPGADGTIGAKYVTNAKPDGYTLLYGTVSALQPLFVRNPIDPEKDLKSISQVTFTPYLVVARPGLPIKNWADVVAYSKTNAEELKLGSVAPPFTLTFQTLMARTGIAADKIRVIPYKGSSEVIIALQAGDVDLAVGSAPTYATLVKSGKIQPLLFTSETRASKLLPDVPTTSELGIQNFATGIRAGAWAPAGTPDDVMMRLNALFTDALKQPAVAEAILRSYDLQIVGSTAEEQLKATKAEILFFNDTARKIGYKRPE